MSTPDLSARSCGPIGDAAVDGDAGEVGVIREALRRRPRSARTARASARGSGRACSRAPPAPPRATCSMRLRIGSRNAAVLPVPVSAQPIRSSPFMTIGMTALWIGVVASKPRTRMPSMSDGSRPSVSKATGLRIVFGLRPRDRRACGRAAGCVPRRGAARCLARAAASSSPAPVV